MLSNSTVQEIINIPTVGNLFSDNSTIRDLSANVSHSDFVEALAHRSETQFSFLEIFALLENLLETQQAKTEMRALATFTEELMDLRFQHPIEEFRDLVLSAKTIHLDMLGVILSVGMPLTDYDLVQTANGTQVSVELLEYITNPQMILDYMKGYRPFMGCALLAIMLSTGNVTANAQTFNGLSSYDVSELSDESKGLGKIQKKIRKRMVAVHLRDKYHEGRLVPQRNEVSEGGYYNLTPMNGDILHLVNTTLTTNAEGERVWKVYTFDVDTLMANFSIHHHSISPEAFANLVEAGLTIDYNVPTQELIVPEVLVAALVNTYNDIIDNDLHNIRVNYGDAKYIEKPSTIEEVLTQCIIEQFTLRGSSCTYDHIVERDHHVSWLYALGYEDLVSSNRGNAAISSYRYPRFRKLMRAHSNVIKSYSAGTTILF